MTNKIKYKKMKNGEYDSNTNKFVKNSLKNEILKKYKK